MSRKEPWFKFWANDYLMDEKVDAITLEAQGLLVRMWCVCSQRGTLPDDIDEIARLTRCKLQVVQQCFSQCKVFFELRDGLLYSHRMEVEKEKSERSRKNVQKRYPSPISTNGSSLCTSTGSSTSNSNGNANRITSGITQKARISDSQIESNEQKAAAWLFEELGIPADVGTRSIAADAVRLHAKQAGSIVLAVNEILVAARKCRDQGETINRFWFSDQKYLRAVKAANPLANVKFANAEEYIGHAPQPI